MSRAKIRENRAEQMRLTARFFNRILLVILTYFIQNILKISQITKEKTVMCRIF